jgi:hypothetical protein
LLLLVFPQVYSRPRVALLVTVATLCLVAAAARTTRQRPAEQALETRP